MTSIKQKKLPLSYIEISKKNLVHNIKQFRNLVKKGTKIAVVIKGNAYGHGQNEVAKILESYVDYFQVNSFSELKLLRKISKKKTLVLGYVQNSDMLGAVELECILTVFSIEQLKKINQASKKLGKIQEIHIPIDAYLGREGFLLSELSKLLKEIKKCKYLKVSGIYAHFANIEDTLNFSHAQKQIDEYKKALKLAEKFDFKNLQTHMSASSGILVYEKSKGINSIIRLGLSLYGMWPSEDLKYLYKKRTPRFSLKSIISWKTKVAQIKILPKGNTIGYGLTYKTKKTTKIAVIPQGYADGIDRGLSNKGEVLIRGARCKILGRVSMNMFTVDITHLQNVKIEDEVVILGRQNGEEITAEEIAGKIDTINYEVTTRISSLLQRVVI